MSPRHDYELEKYEHTARRDYEQEKKNEQTARHDYELEKKYEQTARHDYEQTVCETRLRKGEGTRI